MAQSSAPVMSGWASAIACCQVDHTIESHGLQNQGHQGVGRAKRIHIHQIKTLSLQQRMGKQPVGPKGARAKHAGSFEDPEVLTEERQSCRVRIIHHEGSGPSLQPVAQGAQATPRHQIQHPQGTTLGQDDSKQYAEISGGPGSWIEKTFPGLKLCSPFLEKQ